MREWNFAIGTGVPPEECNNSWLVPSLERYIGVKGKIHIYLYGEWETLVSPRELRIALINMNKNEIPPLVTVSL